MLLLLLLLLLEKESQCAIYLLAVQGSLIGEQAGWNCGWTQDLAPEEVMILEPMYPAFQLMSCKCRAEYILLVLILQYIIACYDKKLKPEVAVLEKNILLY